MWSSSLLRLGDRVAQDGRMRQDIHRGHGNHLRLCQHLHCLGEKIVVKKKRQSWFLLMLLIAFMLCDLLMFVVFFF